MQSKSVVLACQVGLIVVFLLAWQFLPTVGTLSESSRLLDPYFISSPLRIGQRLLQLVTGSGGSVVIWSYTWPTVAASLFGTAVGMVGGAFLGLLLSNSPFLALILRPFVVAANAMPRVALIPIIVLLFGASLYANVVVGILVVFFVAFFNAYEGGITVSPVLIQNAQLLGASKLDLLIRIRMPYVLAWTLAVLPLGVTFAIISVVTAEILTGYHGMGWLLYTATLTADASLTFAVVLVLAIIGLVAVAGADWIRGRILHWWGR
jgi:NitT/TauT family transport system permease protein